MTAISTILYVHNSADLYGASRSLVRLLGRLDRSRFSPLVVLPEPGPLAEKLRALEVPVVLHPGLPVIARDVVRSPQVVFLPFRFLASTWFLRRLIVSRRISLVHTNTGVMPSPALAARLAGVPHVWHIRDWFQEFRQLWGPYSRYICGNSDRVLAVSNAIAGQFRDRRRVEVLHNGFDLEEFAVPREELRRAFRERWALGEGFVVGTVGRIKLIRKGQETLIEAVAALASRGRPVHCVIVGAPFQGNESHLHELQARVQALGLQNRVAFTGELADPRPAYAAFDAFVLPSGQPEPFGGVVMEAMAMGLPVVATAIGGSVDQVAEGETGYLVPPGDAEAMAERLDRLALDPELRRRMGEAGRTRIAERFSLGGMVSRLEGLYGGLVSGHAPEIRDGSG